MFIDQIMYRKIVLEFIYFFTSSAGYQRYLKNSFYPFDVLSSFKWCSGSAYSSDNLMQLIRMHYYLIIRYFKGKNIIIVENLKKFRCVITIDKTNIIKKIFYLSIRDKHIRTTQGRSYEANNAESYFFA